jgi:hypothetical protein
MSAQPRLTVEYLEPVEVEVEAEPLPDEFSASRLRRSLIIVAAVVLVVASPRSRSSPAWARCAAGSWVPSTPGSHSPRTGSRVPRVAGGRGFIAMRDERASRSRVDPRPLGTTSSRPERRRTRSRFSA